MIFSRIFFSLVLVVATSSILCAQNVVIENPLMNDGTGRAQSIGADMSVEGSPFLFDQYLPAEMTGTNGVVLKQYKIKLNLSDNSVYYLLPDGKEMKLTTPIQKFRILSGNQIVPGSDTIEVTALDKTLNVAGSPVFIACVEGKTNLLKKVVVTFSDKKEYGTTNVTRVFTRKESLFVSKPSSPPVKFVKGESELFEVMADKKKQVMDFVKNNKLSYKSEQDLIQIFKFYNSL